jgi:hypothetical protein
LPLSSDFRASWANFAASGGAAGCPCGLSVPLEQAPVTPVKIISNVMAAIVLLDSLIQRLPFLSTPGNPMERSNMVAQPRMAPDAYLLAVMCTRLSKAAP